MTLENMIQMAGSLAPEGFLESLNAKLWGSIFYTTINIPYGAMVSAISADPKDRASLSTWRNFILAGW